jgi:glycosyltransferase involved in cell wall biosynthesis
MKKFASLSVFFPAYNEEANIEKTVKDAGNILKAYVNLYEIIIIDDGSKDETGKIADRLALADKNIKVIHHCPNKGYGEALKSGFYNAKYPWIAFTDSDGQFDFSEILKLLEKTNQADLIVGYRFNRNDPVMRKINGWLWTHLNNLLLGINVRDVDCAFKLIKKEVIDTIPHLQSERGGMISPELLYKARKNGFKIIEVGVHHYPRRSGTQTGANFKVIIKSFIDLFKLWRSLN